MSETVHACFPDDAVDFALASMRQFKVRRLPVVDSSGVIKGVISLNDIVRAAGARRDVPVNEMIATLADILRVQIGDNSMKPAAVAIDYNGTIAVDGVFDPGARCE